MMGVRLSTAQGSRDFHTKQRSVYFGGTQSQSQFNFYSRDEEEEIEDQKPSVWEMDCKLVIKA